MAADSRIRASDDDRERTVALLREHHAAGRLTVEEFNERMDKAYAAKTLGELDELMADLPAIDLYKLPDASLPPHYRRQIPGHGSLQAATTTGEPQRPPGPGAGIPRRPALTAWSTGTAGSRRPGRPPGAAGSASPWSAS